MPNQGPAERNAARDAGEAFNEIDPWRSERIREGQEAARAGRVRSADEVFGDIAAKHGWDP